MSEHLLLVALRLGVVALGALATLWALRLALHTSGHGSTYLTLAAGFGVLTIGTVVEGALFELGGWTISQVHTVEAITSAAGFALILGAILRSRV